MKRRMGFVSNSSSTGYIITNTSDETKTLVDFVAENPHLLEEFLEYYDWYKKDPSYNMDSMFMDAERENIVFESGEAKPCVFGDDDGTVIGTVFDYILRDGGSSKSFIWRYHDSYR